MAKGPVRAAVFMGPARARKRVVGDTPAHGTGGQGSAVCPRPECGVWVRLRKPQRGVDDLEDRQDTRLRYSSHLAGGGKASVLRGEHPCSGSGMVCD